MFAFTRNAQTKIPEKGVTTPPLLPVSTNYARKKTSRYKEKKSQNKITGVKRIDIC